MIQLREKNLHTRVLYELTMAAAEIMRGRHTRLLVNDRADVALATGASGVHLTTRSIKTSVIRHAFGDEFLIGVSTHSVAQAREARNGQADFAVFGPVFETASKLVYGKPLGLEKLQQVAADLAPFPVLALGGITAANAADCFRAGASGLAAIGLLKDPGVLESVAEEIRARFEELQK